MQDIPHSAGPCPTSKEFAIGSWFVEVALRHLNQNIRLFLNIAEEKAGKNHLHLDLRPHDQAAEVARLEGLGAQRADVGQGADVSWVVMTDPDGNEFCVLRPLPPHQPGEG